MANFRLGRVIPWTREVLAERKRFKDTGSWITSVRNRVIMLTANRTPGRKRIVQVNYAALETPVCVRMGSPDLWVLEEIFDRGEYKRVGDYDLGPVKQIVDLGANAGMSIRYWLHRWPDAKVIGVEPDEFNFEVASLNAGQHRGGKNVRMVRACVAGSERTVSLDRANNETKYVMTDAGDGAGTGGIPALPMTKILKENDALSMIDLLKVDIEGAEREVFENCADWIGRVRHMVLEIHPPYTVEKLLEVCARNGRTFEIIERHPSEPNEVVFLRAVA
jgi:FkbM family methyltransferase